MDLLILMLLIGSLASQQVLCQDVESRAAGADKVESDGGSGGGQPRNIYNQRYMSPHRMMHFGKRLSAVPPPTILTPRVHDPYQPAEKYPYWLSIELDRGQTLQAVPEDAQNRNLVYSLEWPQLDLAPEPVAVDQQKHHHHQQQQQQQQQRAANSLAGQKFLRLLSSSMNEANEGNSEDSAEKAQSLSNIQDEGRDQQQQAINLSARSMQSGRGNTLNLPKAYISSLMYGRQGSSSMSNFSGYNKKADPKENFFMHFGRK